MSEILKVEKSPFRDVKIYRLLKARQKVHDDYGLCICLAHHGGVRHPTHEEPVPRCFEFYNVSHLWEGRGWYWTPEGGMETFSAGQGVTLCPGKVHDYDGFGCYLEDFICFAGPVADQLAKCGVIRPGIVNIGHARALLPIVELASKPDRDSQIKANIALQQLLVNLHFESRGNGESTRHDAMESLLREVAKRPDKRWTVTEMAEMAHLSVNQFIRVFSRHVGLTPKKYIDELKMRLAVERMHDSRQPLAEIAASLGFCDQFHFSKRFKQITGNSPATHNRQFAPSRD